MLRLAFLTTAALAATACVLGEQYPTPPGDDEEEVEVDAGPPPDSELPLDCERRVQPVGSGYHNPGQNCLECHNGQQVGAPIFSIGGTVYDDLAGTIPRVGATIIVIDSEGKVLKLPTQQNGNFYSSAVIVPPLITAVSECPTNKPMVENFRDGDCNSCHTADQTKEPGRIVF